MEFFHSQRFSAQVETLMNQHHVPGLAIAIVENDQTASAGYGKASVDPPMPCTADTLFDIASSSKSLTAASVALLIDDDENHPEVQYDAIMSQLLPDDFVMSETVYTEGVTVEDVLSHRTGMAAHDNSYLGLRAEQPDDARSITRNLRNLPVAAPLRTKYMYSNMMYTVATYLVEVKSKQSFSDFLQSRFFQPLDMQSTSLQPESARARGFGDRIATGCLWEKKNATYHQLPSRDCPEGQGAGSIITSVNDFIKWVKALMNCEHPINEKIYQGLVRMRTIINPNPKWAKPYTSPTLYAAGLDVYYYRGYMVVGHNGVTSGFGSRFFFLPEMKFGAAILGNADGVGSISAILARELIDEILQIPEAERSSKNKNKKVHGAPKHNVVSNLKNQVKDKGKGPSKSKPKDQSKDNEKTGQARQSPKSRVENAKPLDLPLTTYMGKYQHPGYHSLTVEVKNDTLFIDATDRSFGFTLTLNHICERTKFSAILTDFFEGGDDLLSAEFVLDDGKAVKMGLQLENALNHLIWFDRVDQNC